MLYDTHSCRATGIASQYPYLAYLIWKFPLRPFLRELKKLLFTLIQASKGYDRKGEVRR